MLYNLHIMRVIAALGVVYFHITSTSGLNLEWDVGSRGVDVFFVISGFIIAYIGTKSPEHFLRRRLIRVVPFYWAATIVVFAAAFVAPHLFRSTTADIRHLLSSLAFIPRLNTATDEMMPTLVLGWSLNFEMFFYLLFSLSLRISPARAPATCIAIILSFVLLMHSITSTSDMLNFYGRPIVLEFCYGIVAFYAFRWFDERKEAIARTGSFKWLLVATFVGALVALVVLEKYAKDRPRYLVAGIPSFFAVLSALLLERIYAIRSTNKLVYLLGEASYIIYLVHPYIIFAVLRLFVKNTHLSAPIQAALIAALLALTSAISIAIHLWFEKPVMAVLRKRLV